jgi:hypothetical protein
MKKRAPACDVEETRARLEDWIDQWVREPGDTLPSWAKVVAREAGLTARDFEDMTVWTKRWAGRELTNQARYASNSQVCGYAHVLNKYMGEGRRFRRRLARTKLAGMRRRSRK